MPPAGGTRLRPATMDLRARPRRSVVVSSREPDFSSGALHTGELPELSRISTKTPKGRPRVDPFLLTKLPVCPTKPAPWGLQTITDTYDPEQTQASIGFWRFCSESMRLQITAHAQHADGPFSALDGRARRRPARGAVRFRHGHQLDTCIGDCKLQIEDSRIAD